MKKKSKIWSIQISTEISDALKEFCKDNGLKMNWVTEQAIQKYISGSLDKKFNE